MLYVIGFVIVLAAALAYRYRKVSSMTWAERGCRGRTEPGSAAPYAAKGEPIGTLDMVVTRKDGTVERYHAPAKVME